MNPTSDGRPLAAAIARMLDAAQMLVARRLELFRVNATGDFSRIARVLVLALFGVLVVTTGWILVLGSITVALAPWVPPAATLVGLGGLHVIGGGVMARRAVGRLQEESRQSNRRALEPNTEELLVPALDPANDTDDDTNKPRAAHNRNSGGDSAESTGTA